MSADRRDAALEAALIAARQAGAADVEVSYLGTSTEFVRFASSRFTQVGSTVSDALRIRVLADGRLGSQMCATLEPAAVASTAAAAVDVARMSPPLEVPFGFGQPRDESVGVADAPPLREELSAANAPALLAAAFAPHRAAGVQFAGALKGNTSHYAVRTSAGVRRQFTSVRVSTQLIGLAGSASGFAGSYTPGDELVDLTAVAAAAADRALRSRDPIDLPPGAYDVVLAPAAFAELIEWMAAVSFGAVALLDGTSLLAGRHGVALCDERVTLSDEVGPGDAPFDAEGTSRQPVTFIDRGAGGQAVTDLATAARLRDGRGSTGHAAPITDDFATGPAVHHLRMAVGDATEDELVGRVDRGLYLTRLHYVNGLLNPRKATTTGMTRDGTFLIEGGKVGRAVANLRFTEHLLEALSRVGGIGRDAEAVPTWWSEGGTITTPAVLLGGFHFTGKSR